MLRLIGLLLVLWLLAIAIGAVLEGLLSLAVVGLVLLAATTALRWSRRNTRA